MAKKGDFTRKSPLSRATERLSSTTDRLSSTTDRLSCATERLSCATEWHYVNISKESALLSSSLNDEDLS